MRKTFLIGGLALLVGGIALAVISIQQARSEEQILGKWDSFGPSMITLQDPGPSWALEMTEGSFFELDVSASDAVRLEIGVPTYSEDVGKEVLTNLVFDQVGTSFTQNITIHENGTYQIEIHNEAMTNVIVWGSISARSVFTTYVALYPHSSSGALVMLGGLFSLIYGVLTKPKKIHVPRLSHE
jgi:hypothetical protein